MKHNWPFSSGYFPMGIIRPWSALRKRRCIRQVNVRVSVDEDIISAREQLFKWDTVKGRPMYRKPSVPSDSFQLAPQQASCVDYGFDLSIASFPLMCLSSDGSRLYPSIAESTTSVPPFFTRSFTPENIAHQFGSTLALQHNIPRPRDPLLPARHSLPFSP